MRYRWQGWILFGAGTLFGLVGGGALFAPPELANQPPPWDHWALRPAPAAKPSGAAPAQAAAVPAPVQDAPAAAAAPIATGPTPAAEAVTPAPAVATAPAIASAPLAAPAATPQTGAAAVIENVAAVTRPPVVKKRKVPREEPVLDTRAAGAGRAPEAIRVLPEGSRSPADAAAPHGEGEVAP